MNQQPYSSSTPENSTLAIVSLVAGILGLSLFPGIASIIALITGNMAKKEINASGGRIGGEGMAKVGLILGWVGVGLMVLGVCCFGIFFLLPFLGIAIDGFSAAPGVLPLFF